MLICSFRQDQTFTEADLNDRLGVVSERRHLCPRPGKATFVPSVNQGQLSTWASVSGYAGKVVEGGHSPTPINDR